MPNQNGIGANTYQRIVMGPGEVKINGTTIGATKGGNVLEINRTFRDIRPDGAMGKVKGFRYVESVEVKLTVNLLELQEDSLYYSLAGSYMNANVITGGDIVNGTYIGAVYLECEVKGVTATTENNLITVELDNCLVEGPMTLTLPESGEVVLQLVFVAHYSASALTTEPWKITFVPVT
jgi:hypothetical protein